MRSKEISYITNQLNNILNTKFLQLKETISEVSKNTKSGNITINSNKKVFNFDKIADMVYNGNSKPKSVDMIHIQNNIIYLIEFKDVLIFREDKEDKEDKEDIKSNIKLKSIESLIILHKLLENLNINFSKIIDLNIYYYIVCKENINLEQNALNRSRVYNNAMLANIPHYKNTYFKDIKISSFKSFEKDFILKYF